MAGLPDGFPPITVHQCDAGRREPGLMILSLGHGTRAVQRTSAFEALVALDSNGDPVWVWQSDICLMDVKLTPRGTLLVVSTDGCIQEISGAGETVRRWTSPLAKPEARPGDIPVDTPYFHHVVRELPNGNFAALSIEAREFEDYPQTVVEPDAALGPRKLVGDTLVEFTPNGDIVHEYRFLDILDPRRAGYGLDAPFWTICGVVPGGADWSHANGVDYDPSDDSFLVTVRHQDCVIKIDRTSGALKWILGTSAGWQAPWSGKLLTPKGNTQWHWHPHDPSIMADASILLFDNGESGAFPPAPRPGINELVSRAVAYRINENDMTVEQVWAFGGPDDGTPYSMYVSGAYELPATGNVFVTFGGIILTKDGNERTMLPPAGHGSAEVFEVTRTGDVVFHAGINNRQTDEEAGWAIFRSEWVPDGILAT